MILLHCVISEYLDPNLVEEVFHELLCVVGGWENPADAADDDFIARERPGRSCLSLGLMGRWSHLSRTVKSHVPGNIIGLVDKSVSLGMPDPLIVELCGTMRVAGLSYYDLYI